ncbi:MAG: histidine phosphatase family protein [Pseudomonas sp.]|nr:histidine phosphatase family protein [Pseudomonas sp.]
MQITLARHGKPDLKLDSWVSPMAMPDWLRHYDQAGIVAGEAPATTLAQAAAAGVLASSTLPRCVQSAQRLAPGREFLREALFCEAELPYPHWLYPKLPPLAWEALFRLAWFYGLSALARPRLATELRAHEAAQRLIQLAREHDSVFLVGHGLMILLIARELLALGWRGPKRPVSGYWQCSVYRASD